MRLFPVTALLALLAAAAPAAAQDHDVAQGLNTAIVPAYDIWSVKLGQPISQIPDRQIAFAACGTNGGPPGTTLKSVGDYAQCQPEASGLHEIYFEYDDEEAYIAKATQVEFPVMQGGTSMFGHPVVVSVLADDGGIVHGIRVVTDDRASLDDRTFAAALENNLKGRFSSWALDCQKLPPVDGETGLGSMFIHDVCTGADPATGDKLRIEAHYFRKKGQTGVDAQTLNEVPGDFESTTRFEVDQPPYAPRDQ